MKFFEKVKNMFTEEVEDDDVEKEVQVKKEMTRVPIKSALEEDDTEREEVTYTPQKKEPAPIFFDDNDFEDLNIGKKAPVEEPKKEIKEKEVYKPKIKKEVEEEKKLFKPTPIISPVYGVLDKNYHKEDIVSRSESRTAKNSFESSIDTIRNKAYGTLEDELENTLFGSNSVLFKNDDDEQKKTEISEIDDDSLTDLTDDISKELDELLVKKEKYSEDEKTAEDEDLLGFIDSTLYKKGDE